MSLGKVLDSQIESYADRLARHEARNKPRLGIWLSAIQKRKDAHTNSNIVVTGEPGIGKSTLSLVCGEKLRPEIYLDHPQEAVERFVTFTGSEFGRAIRDSPDGSVIIGDEFGQQMQHRNYMKRQNIALSNVLQGFRFKEYITFLNLPGLHYIDVDAQGLLTWMANVEKRGKAHVYRVTHPKFNGTDYFHSFVERMIFEQPSKELWAAYAEKKVKNQEAVIDAEINLMEQVEAPSLSDAEIIEQVLESPDAFKKKDKFHTAKIESRFGVGHTRAYRIKVQLIEKVQDKAEMASIESVREGES